MAGAIVISCYFLRLRIASNLLAVAGVLLIPLFIVGQDCSSFAGKTYKELQSQSDVLGRSLNLEQQRAESADRRIWSNADVAGTNIYNFNLGLFLGRAEDYEQLDQTLDQANRAFRTGNSRLGMAKTLDVFREAKDMVSGIGGVLSPAPYTAIPSTPQDAWKFVNSATKSLHNFTIDGHGAVVALAKTGDAMGDSEHALIAAASLRREIATLQRCMNYVSYGSQHNDSSENPNPPKGLNGSQIANWCYDWGKACDGGCERYAPNNVKIVHCQGECGIKTNRCADAK